MSNIYELSFFSTIKKNGFDYIIPEESRELITLLANLVGSPNYSKSPYFVKSVKKRKPVNAANEMSWDIIRNYKKTVIKEKTDVEKELDNIRKLMNKLTDQTYEKIIPQIKSTIKDIEDNKTLEQVISLLFKIASSNRFYSKLYVKLYTELKVDFPIIKEYFDSNLKNYLELFTTIQSCNPDKDYNKFCEINKINENRRSISAFITNCMLNDELELSIITTIFYKLQTLIQESVDDIMKLEEITENIYIIISTGLDKIVLSDEWGNMYNIIQQNSENKSYNNKIRFRFMDLLDLTN